MKAIRINEIGGPEVMQLEEVETPTPQEDEVLIKVAAAGVTQVDLAQRQGTYLTRTRTPMILGSGAWPRGKHASGGYSCGFLRRRGLC